VVTTWYQGDFFALAKPGCSMPTSAQWRAVLESIREEVKDISDRPWSFQQVRQPPVTPLVLSRLAIQVLQVARPFPHVSALSEKGVEVRREAEFWAETIELQNVLQPGLTLTVHSSILFKGNLAEFYQNHPTRHNLEDLLIGLRVQSIETGGSGIITELIGTIGEQREDLIVAATGSTSKQALREAPSAQPGVGVKFGKNKTLYRYAMAALRPCITEETADKFDVQYGKLLRSTKIPYLERQALLTSYKQSASETLAEYGFQLERSVNSRNYPTLFWQPAIPIEQTPLLFGNGFTGVRGQILRGLTSGGVYRRHPDYQLESIKIAALKLCDFRVDAFLSIVQQRLKRYKFENEIIERKAFAVSNLNGAAARAELERAINQLATLSPDIVLIFLPVSDRSTDNDEGGSLYQLAYSQLLRRRIASQVVYADTLNRVEHSQILNQVVPGILAKLGNLPFILAEPLEIADYFIGLDISRSTKTRLPGTMNACASVRLYGKQGEFVRYRLEDALLEGEEIPQRLLERLLPAAELEGKTVLIYRDGPFCGQEIPHLLERARAINSKFILVECRKSGVPRLYNINQRILTSPESGLALRLSPHEAILVTTKVSESVGLARPLRLIIQEQGHPATIEQVVEATLKLTLLHHGALKAPRLPMLIYGADRMAYLKLNGIYPNIPEGDRQFWL